MSNRIDFTLTSPDGTKLCCYEWPAENARAAVVIVHGMADHAARYGRFAEALNAAGITAFSMDLRGHGATATSFIKGWFAKKDGWKAVLGDIRQFSVLAREKAPGRPLLLFAHSMGSLFGRAALQSFGGMYRAAVLSAVTVDIPGRRDIAPLIAGTLSLLSGSSRPSPMLDSLTFGAFNKQFEPIRTRFDWLSRDEAEVDKYLSDENCGFICTGSMFVDISRVLVFTLKKGNVAKMPKDVPLFIISGSEDPVGMNGQAVRFLEKQYKAAGLDVTAKVYEKARHNLLDETNRDEVTKDILDFINNHLQSAFVGADDPVRP